jgi:hypothetical protein
MSTGPAGILQGLLRVPFADIDEGTQAGLLEVAARGRDLSGFEFGAHDDTAAVIAHRRGQVGRRDAKGGAELDDTLSAQGARDEIQELALLWRHGHVEILETLHLLRHGRFVATELVADE